MPEKQPEIKLTCPECSWPLVVRTNRQNGTQFLGCSHWPECTFTRELTPYLIAKMSGAPTLF